MEPDALEGDHAAVRDIVLRGGAGGLAAWDAIDKTELLVVGNGGIAPPPTPMGTAATGDRFGWSLAAGRVDLDARADLMVGAMCDSDQTSCGGAVHLFQGSATSMRGWRRLARATPAAFDRLGWSVAIFDRDGDGDGDLAAGAPFATVNGQAGAGLVQLWNTAGNSVSTSSWFSQSGFAADEVGDQFGASLASVQHQILFSPAQLFVGVPVEGMNGDDLEVGVVQRFTVTSSALAHNAMIRESPGGAEEEGDEFGRAVAVYGTAAGTFIFVGAPGENNDSGAVLVLGALGNVAPAHRQVLVQHGKGTHTAP